MCLQIAHDVFDSDCMICVDFNSVPCPAPVLVKLLCYKTGLQYSISNLSQWGSSLIILIDERVAPRTGTV